MVVDLCNLTACDEVVNNLLYEKGIKLGGLPKFSCKRHCIIQRAPTVRQSTLIHSIYQSNWMEILICLFEETKNNSASCHYFAA
mmetsp:Transcript_16601/g.25320  ORF Transcript_16601/g.25320 Transcript_16601/m.25320 type:complete len:84 (+) Transcript_16601:66-317(+)